jgi:hypothetical protein
MIPILALIVSLRENEPFGPKVYPPVYVPAEAPYGYVYQPATDVHALPRPPEGRYCPKPGDVLLMSDPDPLFTMLFRVARSGKPGHCGLVVTMPDGRLGSLQSGFGFVPWTRVVPLEYALNVYGGHIWVRPRTVPLTPEQDRLLTEFAVMSDGGEYALRRYGRQLTLIRSRNPLITRFAGKPVGPGHKYTCVQILVEALVYAGAVDERTARPAATYAQDLFYDRSRNPYIDRHPPLAGGCWGEPQLWTPIPGTALRGRDRPKPPSPWPGAGGAYVINPIPNGGGQPPTPTVVGYVPGELRPIATVEDPPQRIGFFDRPYRLFSRHR